MEAVYARGAGLSCVSRMSDQLLRSVEGVDRSLILHNNNPAPDALASALAQQHLLLGRSGLAPEVAWPHSEH